MRNSPPTSVAKEAALKRRRSPEHDEAGAASSSLVLHLTDPDARHIYARTVFASTCLQCPGRLGFRSAAAAEYDQDGRYGISRCRTFRCKGAVLWLSSCASFPGTG